MIDNAAFLMNKTNGSQMYSILLGLLEPVGVELQVNKTVELRSRALGGEKQA